MLVVPQEICEGEKGKIVISPLEASEASYGNDNKKQFFDVLKHAE